MAELPHVMISYQWDAQKRMLKLRDELTKAGYDVWMDVDQMGKLNTSYCSTNKCKNEQQRLKWPQMGKLSTIIYLLMSHHRHTVDAGGRKSP